MGWREFTTEFFRRMKETKFITEQRSAGCDKGIRRSPLLICDDEIFRDVRRDGVRPGRAARAHTAVDHDWNCDHESAHGDHMSGEIPFKFAKY